MGKGMACDMPEKSGGKGIMKKLLKGILRLFVAVMLVLMLLPLFMVISDSLMGKQELLETCGAVLSDYDGEVRFRIFPRYPTLRAYVRLLLDSPEYFAAFWNSVFQTCGVILGQLLVSVPAAWAFARFRFSGRRFLWILYLLLMILPFQVTMVPGYLVLNTAGLMDTRAAVVLPGIFSTLPVFILQKTFAGLPTEAIEAAKLDGAGEFCVFLYIGIPMGLTGIFSVVVLSFLEYWNAIEQPMTYLKTEALWPLSLYLPRMVSEEIMTAFAASAVTLLPALFLFFGGQESLEQGIMLSGMDASDVRQRL